MNKKYRIEQKSNLHGAEIEDLRASVGWDRMAGIYSAVIPKLFTFFTAKYNGQLVGFISVISDGICDAYIQDLLVHPEHQNQGIGSELLKRTIEYLKSINMKCIQITFESKLEDYYKKFGFHIFKAGIIDRDSSKLK